MSICKTPIFTGQAACAKLLKKVKGFELLVKGTTQTEANFQLLSDIKSKIANTTLASRIADVFELYGYERTTDDPAIQTSNLGTKTVDEDPSPSASATLKFSFCDYKNLHDLEDIEFEIVFWTSNGLKLGSKKADGTIKGFRGRIATRKDLPPSDNAQNSYPVNIFLDRAEEFKAMVAYEPTFNFADVADVKPAGYNVKVTTAYNTGTGVVVLKVVERCTNNPVTGLGVSDFPIIDSDGTPTVAVTAVNDNGLGSYDVTIQEDTAGTPAALSSGDFYELQAQNDDSSFATHLSNVLREEIA